MNIIARIAIGAVAVAVVGHFGPWWVGLPCIAAVEWFMGRRGGYPFIAGFYSMALPWMVMALWLDVANGRTLSTRVSALFSLPDFPFLLVLLTGLIGGLLGGWAGITTAWIRNFFDRDERG